MFEQILQIRWKRNSYPTFSRIFSFIITLGFNSCTSPCSNHVSSVFIRKDFWEAVRMATNVNTSGPPLPLLPPPPRLPLLPLGFATAPKAGENGKLGSQRGPLLRKDNVGSAEHTQKVRTVGVFVLKRARPRRTADSSCHRCRLIASPYPLAS